MLCDGDACIIAGTEGQMRFYLDKLMENKNEFTIKKTRFGEIMVGIGEGAAYAFDETSYDRLLPLAIKMGITDLPPKDCFAEPSKTGMHFIMVQMAGE